MYEKLYQDFTEKVLPKVADGLVITKDYFIDLFGRYVKYLIITDTISSVMWLLVFFLGVYFIYFKFRKLIMERTAGAGFLFGLFLIFPLGLGIEKTFDVVKDIYIPEVRVYEELQVNNK